MWEDEINPGKSVFGKKQQKELFPYLQYVNWEGKAHLTQHISYTKQAIVSS